MSDEPRSTTEPPPAAPPAPPLAATPGPDGLESYNRVAETVGMMPSLRLKDNLIQLVVVLAGSAIGTITAFMIARAHGNTGQDLLLLTVLGAVLGFIVFGVLSGLVLMVIGWARAISGWHSERRG